MAAITDDVTAADALSISPARAFWAAWSGWMLDGFDGGLYIFVLVPALIDLLHSGGLQASKANIAQHGGYLFSIFMLGWACSMFWGWMADRFGRVRIMCLTILMYSFATALCGVAWSLTSFAMFRFLAGFGVGGEWAAGTPMLRNRCRSRCVSAWRASCIPPRRSADCGGVRLVPVGWRGVFLLGVLPALLTVWLQRSVPEPKVWRIGAAEWRRAPAAALAAAGIGPLFRGVQARTT